EDAGAFGERGEGIEFAEGAGRGLQRTERVDETRQDLFIELPLARECLVARSQHPVLEALELLGDEALGRLYGLAAHVILRHSLGIAPRNLDEEPLHAGVAALERRKSGALALAPLELEKELISVGCNTPQLVELAVVAWGDHVAIAHERRGLGGDGGGEQRHDVLMLAHPAAQLPDQRRIERLERGPHGRQRSERAAQLRQVARPRR